MPYPALPFQELESAQEAFVSLIGQIRMDSKLKFLEWVCREYNPVISPGDGGRGANGVIEEEPEAPGKELLSSLTLYLMSPWGKRV